MEREPLPFDHYQYDPRYLVPTPFASGNFTCATDQHPLAERLDILIKPGDVLKHTIRLSPTANAFLPGHRIRLDITSSDFSNYDRNHNTAADQNADRELAVAQQSVHHGGADPSKIILPWVANAGKR